MNTLQILDDGGIELTAELRELIATTDDLSNVIDECIDLRQENQVLQEENVQLKELLAENDIDFGDMFYSSDRGNEMTHGG